MGARKLNFGFFGRLTNTLQRHLVAGQVNVGLAREFGDQPFENDIIKIVATEMIVACGGLHLEDTVTELHDRNIKGSAAKVENQYRLLDILLIEPVGQGRRGWFVDDPQHFQTRDRPRIFGRLPLTIGKVCRNRNHSLGDRLTQIRFCILLELLQNHRRDFLRRMASATNLDINRVVTSGDTVIGDMRSFGFGFIPTSSNKPFDAEHGIFSIGYSLTLGKLTDESIAIFAKANHTRSGAPTF